jgi:hypothetical protein
MSSTVPVQNQQPSPAPEVRAPGLSLLVIADDTVANFALPSIQRDLNVAASTLPWTISAQVLSFGARARMAMNARLSSLHEHPHPIRAEEGA